MVQYVLFNNKDKMSTQCTDVNQNDTLKNVIENYIKDTKVHVTYRLQRKYASEIVPIDTYSSKDLLYENDTLYETELVSIHSDEMLPTETTPVMKDIYPPNGNLLVELREIENKKIQIYVKTLDGRTLHFIISIFMKVSEFKKLIDTEYSTKLRLVWHGKQLENDQTIEEIKIASCSVVHCVLSLRGGMFHASSGVVPNHIYGHIFINGKVYRSNTPTISIQYIRNLIKIINEETDVDYKLLLTNPSMIQSLPKNIIAKLISSTY